MTLPSSGTLPKSDFRNAYPKHFRSNAHFIIATGYQDVRSNVNKDTDEVTITVSIYEAIEKRLNSLGFPDRILKRRYAIKAEDPKTVGGSIKRLDIVVQTTEPNRSRIRYIFEAKRLRKGDFTIGKYCDEGIMRFINEVYAPECPEVAMIGFFQDADADYWVKELERKFEEDTTLQMRVSVKLKKIGVIPELTQEFISEHTCKSGKGLHLFHIFLESD